MNRKVVPVFNFCRPARHNELCRPAPHNELVVVYLLRRNATCHFKKSWPSMNQDARTRNRNLVGVLRTTEHKQGSRISSNARAAVTTLPSRLLHHFFDFSDFFLFGTSSERTHVPCFRPHITLVPRQILKLPFGSFGAMPAFLLLLLAVLINSATAILYNPSFSGGIGCNAGQPNISGAVGDNSCSTPNIARQATNGAGGECANARATKAVR